MNGVLDGLIGKCCLVYLDDIIIFSHNVQDHLNHDKLVSQRLCDHNLKIKLSKCKFAQTQVEYLSHIISNGCIKPNPLKVASVADFKRPTNVKGMQSFLGLVSYYRKFIKDCASLAFAYNTATHASTRRLGCLSTIAESALGSIMSTNKLRVVLNPWNIRHRGTAGIPSAFEQITSNRDLSMNRNKIRHDRHVRAANLNYMTSFGSSTPP